MSSRRTFVKRLSTLGVTLPFVSNSYAWSLFNEDDSINWEEVRRAFPITNWDKVYLNSGSAGVMPTPVQESLIEFMKYCNSKAPYAVWDEWQEIKKDNLKRLATMIHAQPEELQVVRNTTEALNMIIYGFPLNEGDEVIIAKHDYPFAINAWKNRSNRDGVVINEIKIPIPADDESIVTHYVNTFTEKTKVVHLTHVTHREGHILPIKKIVKAAKERGIECVIDGAHAVGQLQVDINDLGCDFYASSLHKWLNAPLGTGLLFVKKEKISRLYNHPSSILGTEDSINKFEHLGTRAWANEIAISGALDFYDAIGIVNKSNRLQELKEYWMTKFEKLPNAKLYTWTDARYSGAVSSVGIEGFGGSKMTKVLGDEFDVHVKQIDTFKGQGIRVSPNIFTSFEDLDRLIAGLTKIANQ